MVMRTFRFAREDIIPGRYGQLRDTVSFETKCTVAPKASHDDVHNTAELI